MTGSLLIPFSLLVVNNCYQFIWVDSINLVHQRSCVVPRQALHSHLFLLFLNFSPISHHGREYWPIDGTWWQFTVNQGPLQLCIRQFLVIEVLIAVDILDNICCRLLKYSKGEAQNPFSSPTNSSVLPNHCNKQSVQITHTAELDVGPKSSHCIPTLYSKYWYGLGYFYNLQYGSIPSQELWEQ